jgi:hypothetical protein
LVIVLVVMALPSQVLAGGQRHFWGHDAGVLAINASGQCAVGFIPIALDGAGRATHLGNYSYKATECHNPATRATVNGRFTVTAANGDTITGTYTGGVTSRIGAQATYQEQAGVTGGTGRFAGASGQLQINGEANQTTLTYKQRLSGTITSRKPGHRSAGCHAGRPQAA